MLVLLLPFGFSPQEGDRAKEELELKSIKLELSTVGDGFDPVEIVPLRLRFVNQSDARLTLQLNPALPLCATLYLEDSDGHKYRAKSCKPLAQMSPLAVELNPGDYYETTGYVSPSFAPAKEGSEFRPPKEGMWRVSAARELRFVKVNSNRGAFRIREDKTLTREIREVFGSESWHRCALGEGVDTPARYLAFLKSGVEARQADAMSYLLGMYYLNQGLYAEAIEKYNEALKRGARSVRKPDVILGLAQALSFQDKLTEAIDILNQGDADPHDVSRNRLEDLRSTLMARKKESEGIKK